jgi:hypothetical protein
MRRYAPGRRGDDNRVTRLGPPKKSHSYLLVFIVLVAAPALVSAFFVSANFRPEVTEDFRFLFFGVASAVSIGVWSTLVLSDKRHLFFPTVLTLAAAIVALGAAIGGAGSAPVLLDTSVSFLLVGLLWMLMQATWHVIRAESEPQSAAKPH